MKTGRFVRLVAMTACAAVAPVRAAAAQVPPAQGPVAPVMPAQADEYLLATDAVDARALYVNPAGLARRIEASLGGFITANDAVSSTRVSQYGGQLATRGIGAGWQHDRFSKPGAGNTYIAGAGFGDEQFAMGASHRWYRDGGGRRGGSWDIGAHVRNGTLDLAAVWRNIASPTVRMTNGDTTLEETLVAGAALDIAGRGRVAAEWRGATSGFTTRTVRAGATLVAGRGVLLSALWIMSPSRELRGFSLAAQLSTPKFRLALFGRNAADRSVPNQYGASLASVTVVPTGRRTFR